MMQRRQILQGMASMVAASALRPVAAATAVQEKSAAPNDVTARLARYMVAARDRPLPSEVGQAAKHRILDTFGAIVSGAQLKPGEMAIRYVQTLGGSSEASVPATRVRTSAINAALAAGMFAHADETDDFEP